MSKPRPFISPFVSWSGNHYDWVFKPMWKCFKSQLLWWLPDCQVSQFLSHLGSTQLNYPLTKLDFVAPATSKMATSSKPKQKLQNVPLGGYEWHHLVTFMFFFTLWFHSCVFLSLCPLCFHRAPVEGDRDEAVQSTRFPPAAAGRWNHWWNEGGGQWLQ